jgi:hypothetical protein
MNVKSLIIIYLGKFGIHSGEQIVAGDLIYAKQMVLTLLHRQAIDSEPRKNKLDWLWTSPRLVDARQG